MSLDELSEFGEIVANSSIINKTRFLIEDNKQDLTEQEKFILNQAIKFLFNLINGIEFMESNNVCPRNLRDSINAYNHSKSVLKNFTETKESLNILRKTIGELINWKDTNSLNISVESKNILNELGHSLLNNSLKHTKTLTI